MFTIKYKKLLHNAKITVTFLLKNVNLYKYDYIIIIIVA